MSTIKKLAIIGCTDILFTYVFNGIKGLPIEVVAVASENKPNLMRFSRMYATGTIYSDFYKMLERESPDIVISFPDDDAQQFEAAKAGIESGAWVFSERPVSRDVDKINILIKLQQDTGKYIIPRYNRRYMPAYIMANEIIRQKGFGNNRIYYSKFHASAYGTEEAFIWNHMSHLLDLARFMLGEVSITHLQRTFISDPYLVYDITVESETGCIGTIQACSTICDNYPIERMELHADINSVIIDNQIDLQYNRYVNDQINIDSANVSDDRFCLQWIPNTNHLFKYSIDGMENLFIHMLNCMESHEKPRQEMEDLKKTLLLTEYLEQLAEGQRK